MRFSEVFRPYLKTSLTSLPTMYSLSRSSPQYLLWLQEAWPLDQPTQFEKKCGKIKLNLRAGNNFDESSVVQAQQIISLICSDLKEPPIKRARY